VTATLAHGKNFRVLPLSPMLFHWRVIPVN